MENHMGENWWQPAQTGLVRTLFEKVVEAVERKQRMRADHPRKYDPTSGNDGNHPFAHVMAQVYRHLVCAVGTWTACSITRHAGFEVEYLLSRAIHEADQALALVGWAGRFAFLVLVCLTLLSLWHDGLFVRREVRAPSLCDQALKR